MLDSDKVKASEAGKNRLREAMKNAKLTQEELANLANVGVDTIKRLLGTKLAPNGVERWAVKNITKVLNISPLEIVNTQDWNQYLQLPQEFEPLIKEKISPFCGREFVFAAFDEFLKNNINGYFILEGYAGAGKSTIAAQCAVKYQSLCYFTNYSDSYESFEKSIRKQLINRYNLEDSPYDNLISLLTNASRTSNEPIVIVIDALNEVDHKLKPGQNVLFLPDYLPKNTYFFVTRQPYDFSIKNPLRLINSRVKYFNLNADEYKINNYEDIRKYIKHLLNESHCKEYLNKWIINYNLEYQSFIDRLLKKSDANFKVLKIWLNSIVLDNYDDPNFEDIPKRLNNYYENHWEIMGMRDPALPIELMEKSLFILVNYDDFIELDKLAGLIDKDEYETENILKRWIEFLRKTRQQGKDCYKIHHPGFLLFLKSQNALKPEREIFYTLNQKLNNLKSLCNT
ncbi:hypothetical protein AMR41_02220 [Hapalosiphon sp. MRB220]|nr:hypothetical protein AMR41_02220 [Hapalosiphon sp. MRB220]